MGGRVKVHPRSIIVREAERDLQLAIVEALTRHKLTSAETVAVITRVFAEEIGGLTKYCIRKERHGDEDKPGDVE